MSDPLKSVRQQRGWIEIPDLRWLAFWLFIAGVIVGGLVIWALLP